MLKIFRNNKVDSRILSPLNQTQEVLYMLIVNKSVARKEFMDQALVMNAPAIIHRLRVDYNIPIETNKVSAINKFKRSVNYGVYSIKNENKGKAVAIYIELLSKS